MAELSVHRTGTRVGVARNDRGAELRYGPVEVEGSFTPGELLALALAACNLMSADHALARRLGDDVAASARVALDKDGPGNRYVGGRVELAVDGLAALDDAARARLVDVVTRAVDQACTVGRTLEHGLPHSLDVGAAR